eukprot:15447880-Alexandrium_andersonii.AAC.1
MAPLPARTHLLGGGHHRCLQRWSGRTPRRNRIGLVCLGSGRSRAESEPDNGDRASGHSE